MNIPKRWVLQAPIPAEISSLLAGHPPVLRQILYSRGITSAEEAARFLAADLPAVCDPFRLLGMEAAVDRIQAAVRAGERIAVYGDYDADGVTATALLVQVLKGLGAAVEAYIPNRFEEGYGLNNEALTELNSQGFGLVITVDCGIRSHDEAAHARVIGLDLIITDHHAPGENLPDALAVINPKQPGDPYPEKNLAGVGVAYKLAGALVERMDGPLFDLTQVLDLVALGTVADLVPLVGENRALVRRGLEQLRSTRRQGLFSLMNAAGLQPGKMTAANIGFGLGPRLNAAGRLDSALAAYHLLTETDAIRAGDLAQKLDNQNRERQQITRDMQARAEALAIQDGSLPFLLFAADPDFNPGVVGLAASRLTEQYYRPAIVGHRTAATTRASCRSIREFDVTAALDQCADLLIRHGGHAAAAGFTVANENLDALIRRLTALATAKLEGYDDLRPVVHADAEVPLADLTFTLLQQLEQLQPTGNDNPEPVFITKGLRVIRHQKVGRDGAHLKLVLGEGRQTLDAIAFRLGDRADDLPPRIDVLYHFEKNEYQGVVSPQLNIRDLRPSA